MSSPGVFDPGLQPERTLLAWRRTALALGVGGVVGGRLALDVLGLAAVVLAVAVIAAALIAYLGAAERYRRTHAHLVSRAAGLPGGGVPLAILSAGVGLLALGSLGYVLLLAVGSGDGGR